MNANLLIFNPHSGKRGIRIGGETTVRDVQNLLKQYQIPVDLAPTLNKNDAYNLAKKAVKQKYERVFVAGGDGTVGEVANALIDTDVTLGIIPMGTVMNVANMLSIPLDIEKAIMLLRIDHRRKIDVGCITRMDGEKMAEPEYFLESAGVGLEAQFHDYFKKLEEGDISIIWKMITVLLSFYKNTLTVETDGKVQQVKATLVNISNGPLSGAALPLAPQAKLNDTVLTVGLYKMNAFEIMWYLWRAIHGKIEINKKKVEFITAKKVAISAKKHIPIHADARIFTKTPATFEVKPKSLKIVCGFPIPNEETAMKQ